jgi:hypothetical protein
MYQFVYQFDSKKVDFLQLVKNIATSEKHKSQKDEGLSLTPRLSSFIEKPGHHFSRPVLSTPHPPSRTIDLTGRW